MYGILLFANEKIILSNFEKNVKSIGKYLAKFGKVTKSYYFLLIKYFSNENDTHRFVPF